MPDPRTAEVRQDGGSETSVNWEDDESVLQITLIDRTIAEHGAARLQLVEIYHAASGVRNVQSPLKPERMHRIGNPHHGNIVFARDLVKLQQRQLASALALKSSLIPGPAAL